MPLRKAHPAIAYQPYPKESFAPASRIRSETGIARRYLTGSRIET
jgi:hypothetical protein